MDQLDPEVFWRVHRSFVVNIQHIREVVPWFKSSYQLRMDDPKKTEIPRQPQPDQALEGTVQPVSWRRSYRETG